MEIKSIPLVYFPRVRWLYGLGFWEIGSMKRIPPETPSPETSPSPKDKNEDSD